MLHLASHPTTLHLNSTDKEVDMAKARNGPQRMILDLTAPITTDPRGMILTLLILTMDHIQLHLILVSHKRRFCSASNTFILTSLAGSTSAYDNSQPYSHEAQPPQDPHGVSTYYSNHHPDGSGQGGPHATPGGSYLGY